MIPDNIEQIQKLIPLGPWIDLANRAGVNHVPAYFSPEFPVDQIMTAIDCAGNMRAGDVPELDIAFCWLDNEREKFLCNGDPVSARWECCSSAEAKSQAARGAWWSAAYYWLPYDDPRVVDCTVGLTTRLCVRPWIHAVRLDGFPLEFRVYYGPAGYLGTSNYHPQRPITRKMLAAVPTADWTAALCAIHNDAKLLANAGDFPAGFTADFIVDEAWRVHFLEGGPPHIPDWPWSAHPCCFPPGEIDGLILNPRQPGDHVMSDYGVAGPKEEK